MVAILHFPSRERRTSLYERKFNAGVGRLMKWAEEGGVDSDAAYIAAQIGGETHIKSYPLMQKIAVTIDRYANKRERMCLQDWLSEMGE
ncbi:MAG TPA: hypothetical protein VNA25_12680 [Phycisphaerae bacterium]|nr:hypothetical protein [Phycisphaerae bacterium]